MLYHVYFVHDSTTVSRWHCWMPQIKKCFLIYTIWCNISVYLFSFGLLCIIRTNILCRCRLLKNTMLFIHAPIYLLQKTLHGLKMSEITAEDEHKLPRLKCRKTCQVYSGTTFSFTQFIPQLSDPWKVPCLSLNWRHFLFTSKGRKTATFKNHQNQA